MLDKELLDKYLPEALGNVKMSLCMFREEVLKYWAKFGDIVQKSK